MAKKRNFGVMSKNFFDFYVILALKSKKSIRPKKKSKYKLCGEGVDWKCFIIKTNLNFVCLSKI